MSCDRFLFRTTSEAVPLESDLSSKFSALLLLSVTIEMVIDDGGEKSSSKLEIMSSTSSTVDNWASIRVGQNVSTSIAGGVESISVEEGFAVGDLVVGIMAASPG